MRPAPLLYAGIAMPATHTEPCVVVCRVCTDYAVEASDLYAAQRIAWSHDVDHWRRRIPPTVPTKKRVRR
jgi:hypothetical protein